MITRPLPLAYDPDAWLGRSGKASWYPLSTLYRQQGGQIPEGATVLRTGGAMALRMAKPSLMMDPSDATTWQRQYQFTGGVYG